MCEDVFTWDQPKKVSAKNIAPNGMDVVTSPPTLTTQPNHDSTHLTQITIKSDSFDSTGLDSTHSLCAAPKEMCFTMGKPIPMVLSFISLWIAQTLLYIIFITILDMLPQTEFKTKASMKQTSHFEYWLKNCVCLVLCYLECFCAFQLCRNNSPIL